MFEIDHHLWTLSKPGSDGLGLSCEADGLFLGRTSLLEKSNGRVIPRPRAELERLFTRGFGTAVQLDRLMLGLATIAAALNANDLCRARIAAVQLRIPNLPDEFARLDMQLEDIDLKLDRIRKTAGGDWDPDKHPRTGTAPNPGWFAPTDGGNDSGGSDSDSAPQPTLVSDKPSGGDGRLHLPPGERNDEIGDLLEWIANAKPEDAPAIEGEINRIFYQQGDFDDGAMFQHALGEVLRNLNQATRQSILEPIQKDVESEESFVIRWLAPAFLPRGCRCGSLNTALLPIAGACVIRAI